MTFKLNNSIHKFYEYILKKGIHINNRLNKIKVFNHYIFKNKLMKIFVGIIIFVLIFDKFTIMVITGLIYGYESYKNSHKHKFTESYNNFLSSNNVEHNYLIKNYVQHYYDNIEHNYLIKNYYNFL